MTEASPQVSTIDLFCGAGGLSLGLKQAGIDIAAGIDVDPQCEFPFKTNISTPFILRDVRNVTGAELRRIWDKATVRVLAGCAPCQPFSSHRRGADTSLEDEWPLLNEFGRLVHTTRPHVVTMENVLGLTHAEIFNDFVAILKRHRFTLSYKSCYCPEFGLPQHRRRLVSWQVRETGRRSRS